MSFMFFPGGLFKSPRPTWIIEAFTYLHSWHSWCVASVGWGFPRLSKREKQDVQCRGMNEHLRFITTVVFIYNPASASLFPGLSSTSPPVQWRDVTVGNAGEDFLWFCFGSWRLPVNTCTFQVQDCQPEFVVFLLKEPLLTVILFCKSDSEVAGWMTQVHMGENEMVPSSRRVKIRLWSPDCVEWNLLIMWI